MEFVLLVRSWSLRASLTCCLLAGFAAPVLAGRDIGIVVFVDGKAWLVGGAGDDGKANADQVWQYLAKASLQVAKDAKVEPDPKDRSRAKLAGKIEVRIDYGGKASVTELNLVRDKKDSTRWKVAPEDFTALSKVRKVPEKGR